MYETPVYAADLKERITSLNWTQEKFAALFPESNPEHVKKVIRGRRPITLAFALNCLRLLRDSGPITVRQGDDEFIIAHKSSTPSPDPDRIPDDEQLHDLSDAEHNLNVMQQAEDVVRAMQRLVSSPLLLRSDSELSDALRVAKYKEIHELLWAVRGRLREGEQMHPHLVQEGLRLALAERPGYQEEAGAA